MHLSADTKKKISVLMTVYDEFDFVEYAIKACLPYVDHLVIVEGAYQEVIKLGAFPRSKDGTIQIIENYRSDPKVNIIYANAVTDKDQRNIGLDKIKELNSDGWCLIIDGDEVYDPENFKMIQIAVANMERTNKYAVYFKSLTFVNDKNHYTEQEFPRLFKITPGCKFVNDNFMSWEDKGIGWFTPYIIKLPYLRYHHYSFLKGAEKFKQKRDWWMSRGLDPNFDYGWNIDKNGLIDDPNHDIYEYKGHHPSIMKNHPLWK